MKYVVIAVVCLVAVGCVLVVAALLLGGSAPYQATPVAGAPVTAEAGAGSAAGSLDPVVDETQRTHAVAKEELRAAIDERKESIPTEVLEPLEKDMNVVEEAATDLLAALANDPDNASLKQMLIGLYRNELKLLRRTLHLAEGEEEPEFETVE